MLNVLLRRVENIITTCVRGRAYNFPDGELSDHNCYS